MNYVRLCAFLQFVKNDTVSFADIARVRGVERQAIAKTKDKEISREEIVSICEAFDVKPPSEDDNVSIESANNNSDVFAISYWEGCNECSDMLKRDDFADLKLDIELINRWNVKPEDLRIIAMPGEEMNGGEMPIANKDLLVIDISRNNPYESGVFFVTSHNCQRVYVRRLMETLNEKGESVIFSTVDNVIYKKAIEKFWTKEMREEADIRIIGRVITNAIYTI